MLFSYGRDIGYPIPPVQFRRCGITAYGSCLEFWRIVPTEIRGIFGGAEYKHLYGREAFPIQITTSLAPAS